MRFPTSELGDGRTVGYYFRGYDEHGQIIAVANCLIPATDDALRRMDRKLRVNRDRTTPDASVLSSVQLMVLVAEACGPGLIGDPPACFPIRSGTVENSGGGGSEWGWEEYETGAGGTGPNACPASTDPTCLQPLTPTDQATIQNALNTLTRPESEFTDPAAKDACRQMRADFDARLAGGDVFRGAYDTNHFGTEWNGSIHFDPQWLNNAAAGDASAIKELAVTAFHETLHALGYSHGPPTWIGGVDHYYDPLFVHLNPGSNSCVKR